MIEKTEKEIWKEIESGKYRDYYLIYNRKSTDEAESQKNSIKFQKLTNAKYALDNGLNIAPVTLISFCAGGIISEKHSGFKEDDAITFTEDGMVQYHIDRPKFLQLVQLLSKGLFKGIICFCWDRISRNKGDDTIIGKLIKSGIDIRFVYAHYEKTSSGALHMDVDGMFAAHHSRVTSEKVKLVTWSLRDKGVCTYKAPVGYLNEGNMENKPKDPIRGPIIEEMFKIYKKGEKSLSDIAMWANEAGLTMAPMRARRTTEEMLAEDDEDEDEKTEEEREEKIPKISRQLEAKKVQKILKNRFYTGKILGRNKVWINSVSHEKLVDEKLFEEVQLMLKKNRVSIYHTDKIEYLYRGMVHCGECGRVYTPYMKKGIQYYGARCSSGCPNTKKSFNSAFLEEEIGKLIYNLSFSDEELTKLNTQTKSDIAIFEEKRHSEFEMNDRRKKKIREDQIYLRTNKLSLLRSGVYSSEAFLEEENKLNESLIALQDNEQISDIAMHEVIKDLTKLSELVKDGYEHYQYANPEEKEKIARVIFSELILSENTLTYKCKGGIRVLQNRSSAVCEPSRDRDD